MPGVQEAVLLTKETTIRWLTGFTGSEAAVLLMEGKKYFVTDFRYAEMAEGQIPKSYKMVFDRPGKPVTCSMMRDAKTERVLVEESSLTAGDVRILVRETGVTTSPIDKTISAMRSIKTAEETELMRKGAKLTESAFSHILTYMKPGVRECDLYAELIYYLHKHGSEPSFTPIIASGENSSMPHATVTERKLEAGDMVTIDMGCKVGGICTDFTRTVAISGVVQKQELIYNIVADAQDRAIAAVKEGVEASHIDDVARTVITKAGYGDFFGHGTGHGVGYDIHEAPNVNGLSQAVLKAGMVITIEPGIYLPKEFGVRTEDMVLVTENGCEDFYGVSNKLVII